MCLAFTSRSVKGMDDGFVLWRLARAGPVTLLVLPGLWLRSVIFVLVFVIFLIIVSRDIDDSIAESF